VRFLTLCGTKPISEFLPYKFLWPSDEKWLEDIMRYERYDLLKPKTSHDLTDEETTVINKQLESSSVETGVKLF
jgi:hypothetical protein